MRFLLSLVGGGLIGVLIGLYLGWVQFPVQITESPASALARPYQDEYTLMIAQGYLSDGDVDGARLRLRVLGNDDAPAIVRGAAERAITDSRNVDDIRALVGLAAAFGALTPVMEPYRALEGSS